MWPHPQFPGIKDFLMENFIFCAVIIQENMVKFQLQIQ